MRPWLLLLPLLALAATAQTNSAKPGTGTVTGHVYCADTNAPARGASVQLEPARDADDRGAGRPFQYSGPPPGGIVQTAFDGSFTFSAVPPGSYYVIVSAPGYLSPRANGEDFDSAEPPPPAGQPPLVIPKVDVQADQTANVDVRLERGAAISGTVRFDDGSPASGVRVMVLHKSKDKWVGSQFAGIIVGGNLDNTDDLGHYRISGLRDREYLVEVMLNRVDMLTAGPHSAGLRGVQRSSFMIYSGDTAHIHDAVPFKLGAGEEHTGEDITIPLSKFHAISGVVTASIDGHTINHAFIQITNTDDKETIASGQVSSDGTFRIDCVPEGSYLLRVIDASDTQSQDISVGREHNITLSDSKTIHQYGKLEQPIKIEADIPNLVLSVPNKTASQPSPHPTASQ
jgi:Carboxypeptidase regulatory-like domain